MCYIYIFVTNKHFTNLNHLKHMIYPRPQPQASSGLGTSLVFSDKWSPFSAYLLKPGTTLSARGACQVGQGHELSVFTSALPSVWSSLLLFPPYSSSIQTLSSQPSPFHPSYNQADASCSGKTSCGKLSSTRNVPLLVRHLCPALLPHPDFLQHSNNPLSSTSPMSLKVCFSSTCTTITRVFDKIQILDHHHPPTPYPTPYTTLIETILGVIPEDLHFKHFQEFFEHSKARRPQLT